MQFNMRLIFYIFLICQLLNYLDVFAQKVKEDSSQSNPVKWEKEEETKPLKPIIWRSYNNDEIYFENNNRPIRKKINSPEEIINQFSKKSVFSMTEIEPFLPLNNFLDYGDSQSSVRWKSSFQGGSSGGTGQQNPSFVFDYGISDNTLMTIYFSEADDYLYNLIDGQKVNYHWQNYAFSSRSYYGQRKSSFFMTNKLCSHFLKRSYYS